MRTLSLILLLITSVEFTCAQTRDRLTSLVGRQIFVQDNEGVFRLRQEIKGDSSISENPRLVAILLDASLGLLGMHRLYLGTDLKVPILYTLTFGGGAVLWLVDLGLLIFSKDITPYMNNPNVFMWSVHEQKRKKR